MRKADWEKRLMITIAAHKAAPFKWGVSDCALFAADCVEAMTGIDYAEDFRNRYKTEKGAAKALKRYGEGDLVSTVEKYLNRVPGGLNYAQRGDVVAAETEAGVALGICLGTTSVFKTPDGVIGLPTSQCIAAWRVE